MSTLQRPPVTIAEAARRVPFTEPALRGKILRGELTPLKILGRLYISVEELQRVFGPLYQEN
jgi:hypothetical protein